jgi:prevent-host-death family protein
MSQHSIAETKDKLSELVARAEKGEEVVITRHGHPVATISPVRAKAKVAARKISQADIDWLKEHRVAGKVPNQDAGAFVSRMRDEDWAR